MAKLLNVEKSKFINDNIAIYSQNKIGEYSKFLNKNPMFVTYYHINQTLSRSDVGTGGIDSEIGKSSPIRFNKINNFPVYNIPEIKPDITYDESGLDIDLDLSDITLLPNTVKPIPGDYILLAFPGIKEFLFRVNQIRYNTIQSNDFYMIDIDIKRIGLNLEDEIKHQIADTFETIFDNIGTKDNCFIRNTDVDKINDLVKLIDILKENYLDIFYNTEFNAMLLKNNPDLVFSDINLYDLYLEKFIMKSGIYYTPNNTKSFVLTPNEILSDNFQYEFKRSFWNAVMTRSTDFLNKYNYFYQSDIRKKFSPFNVNSKKVNNSILFLSDHNLYPDDDDTTNGISNNIDIPNPLMEYFSIKLIDNIINKELTSEDYIDKIIFNYFLFIKEDIEKSKLLYFLNNNTWRGFTYTPIIIYILNQYYSEYFKVNIDL